MVMTTQALVDEMSQRVHATIGKASGYPLRREWVERCLVNASKGCALILE